MESNRNGGVGLGLEGRPKVWKVYVGRNKEGKRGVEVAVGITELKNT